MRCPSDLFDNDHLSHTTALILYYCINPPNPASRANQTILYWDAILAQYHKTRGHMDADQAATEMQMFYSKELVSEAVHFPF